MKVFQSACFGTFSQYLCFYWIQSCMTPQTVLFGTSKVYIWFRYFFCSFFYTISLASAWFNFQVKEIRSLLSEAEFDVPRIGTIEEFQGQEFDVIILSTVRSCEEYLSSDIAHSLGFVASPKRLNVAISRSKSLLIVIGNPKLLCQDTYWRYVVKYCIDMGCYVGCEFWNVLYYC